MDAGRWFKACMGLGICDPGPGGLDKPISRAYHYLPQGEENNRKGRKREQRKELRETNSVVPGARSGMSQLASALDAERRRAPPTEPAHRVFHLAQSHSGW